MRPEDIAQHRLRSLRISGAPLEGVAGVVHWLGALQAQEYGVAKWSIGQRGTGLTDAALERAVADGTVLRTHLLRPTWHFVLPADLRWMIELTGPRVQAQNAYWYRRFGLDDALFARSNELLAEVLAGGSSLTRKEIAAHLAGHGIAADGLRLGYILMRAELDLVICSGAPKGKSQTYALLEERAPKPGSMAREEALAELTGRYFASRGPATLKDFQWWSSLAADDAKRGLTMVRTRLEQMVVRNRTYWYAAADTGPRPASPTAHLLQGYDEYLIAYGESRDVIDIAGVAGAVGGDRTMFTHAVIVDGQVAGHWRRTVRAKAMTVEVQLVRHLDATDMEALQAAVDRHAAFAQVPGELVVTSAPG